MEESLLGEVLWKGNDKQGWPICVSQSVSRHLWVLVFSFVKGHSTTMRRAGKEDKPYMTLRIVASVAQDVPNRHYYPNVALWTPKSQLFPVSLDLHLAIKSHPGSTVRLSSLSRIWKLKLKECQALAHTDGQ